MTYSHIINRIARRDLGLETLKARNSDSLDFHELPVWDIRKALENAFIMGLIEGARKP